MADDPITRLLGSARKLEIMQPWPRLEVDRSTWLAIGQHLGGGAGDLLSLWAEAGFVHLALRAAGLDHPCVLSLTIEHNAFPSVGQFHPPAIRLERAIQDLYGFIAEGAADTRPWLDHGAWGISAPLGRQTPAARRDPADYKFLPVKGSGLHQIPVGPIHAGIIEPGHFRFSVNGEIVARLEQRLGYVHKGIDGLLAGCDIDQGARVAARISGDSTVAYSFAYARAAEAALGIEVPPRARLLRGIMAELERVANHLGDIGAICNDASFVLAHAHCGILREQILASCDRAFGHRLMMDRVLPGGVATDLSRKAAADIVATLDGVAPRFAKIVSLYDETPSLQDRTCTTGIVDRSLAARWAAGGYVGRASGRNFDTRRDLPYPPYDGASLEIPVFERGDVDARVWVRIKEVEASIKLLKKWLAELPEGPVRIPLPPQSAPREGIALVEAFRGDVLIWMRIEGGKVMRAHARDASWFQWPLLEFAINGNIVADFPLCNKSFNCSYSGHDL
jgi:Ni,Fe-hydrogenase III large subunit